MTTHEPPNGPRNICFVAMPFGKRSVETRTGNSPIKVNFDELWHKVYSPAIEQAGFLPIRADFDLGTSIIKDMLERLAFADLVLADVTMPNGNVYYELGLRHAARESGCIMFAADWSEQLFDIEQFRTVRYPLVDGSIPPTETDTIREIIVGAITDRQRAKTPWYEFMERAPEEGWLADKSGVFRDEAENLARYQADLRAIRLELDEDAKKQKIRAEAEKLQGTPTLKIPVIANDLTLLIRDELGNWQSVIDFIETLPEEMQRLAFFQEQHLLARSKRGEHGPAITHLRELIDRKGATPERLGLIGGRYKKLWREARKKRRASNTPDVESLEEIQSVRNAIEAYDAGMQLDLNEYYCSCNLPLLLKTRGNRNDLKRAQSLSHIVTAACNRALAQNPDDGWATLTLLGVAFGQSDPELASELADEIIGAGLPKWMLKTTFEDIDDLMRFASAEAARNDLTRTLKQLKHYAGLTDPS